MTVVCRSFGMMMTNRIKSADLYGFSKDRGSAKVNGDGDGVGPR